MTGDMTSGLIDNILIGKDKTLEPEIISLTNSFSNRNAIEDKMIILMACSKIPKSIRLVIQDKAEIIMNQDINLIHEASKPRSIPN